MSSNERDARDLRYQEHYHLQPAQQQIRSGNLDRNVMNNLHFVLHKIPNDHRALALLLQWSKAGGSDKDYASPACYLIWARDFAPNDALVWMYGGNYFYQTKNEALARQWWDRALALDPSNADAHYNLGLLLFEQGQYESANIHAQAAYGAGYPLPGLRDKLREKGQWKSLSTADERH
jgi:tetratricopeptide (TPR) repeat protein